MKDVPIILDEYYYWISSPSPHIQDRLLSHKQGDRPPRGRSFDRFRYLEVQINSSQLGKKILKDIASAIKSAEVYTYEQ